MSDEQEYEASLAEIERKFWALIDKAVPRGDPLGFSEPPYFAPLRDAIALAKSEHAKNVARLRAEPPTDSEKLDAAMKDFAEHTTPGGTWIEDEENR